MHAIRTSENAPHRVARPPRSRQLQAALRTEGHFLPYLAFGRQLRMPGPRLGLPGERPDSPADCHVSERSRRVGTRRYPNAAAVFHNEPYMNKCLWAGDFLMWESRLKAGCRL